jgi:putative tricarboxylic transport membrane protein
MTQESPTSEARRLDRAALVIAAVIAILAVVIVYSTATAHGGSATRVGPSAFPYTIAGCLFVLAIWTAFEAVRGDFPVREEQEIQPIIWIIGGLAAQMLLLHITGFAIATGLLFAATARGFGKGPLWMTIPIGIVLSFIIWVIFAKGLQLALPAGPLERLI